MLMIKSLLFVVAGVVAMNTSFSYAEDSTSNVVMPSEKASLLVLPVETAAEIPEELALQVVALVSSRAATLGRYEVYDRNNLGTLLKEQATQLTGAMEVDKAVEIGRLVASKEALVVSVLQFSQKGVPTDSEQERLDKRDFVSTVVEETVVKVADIERYQNNIQTMLAFELRKLDLETGKVLTSWRHSETYTGGNREASRAQTIRQCTGAIDERLRLFYQLRGRILERSGAKLVIAPGADAGVRKGQAYLLRTPMKTREVDGQSYEVPGEEVAYVIVDKTAPKIADARVVRSWGAIPADAELHERVRAALTWRFGGVWFNDPEQWAVKIGAGTTPFYDWDFGFMLGMGQGPDNKDVFPFGVLVDFELGRRVRFSEATSVVLGTGVELGFYNRSDDNDQMATTVLAGFPLRARAEQKLSRNWNLVLGGGYRLFARNSYWTTTDKEGESMGAQWDNGRARMDMSGVFTEMQFQYVMF